MMKYSYYGKIERETFVNAYGLECLFAVDVGLIMEYILIVSVYL